MKVATRNIMATVIGIGLTLGIVGCQFNDAQVKAIAQQTGMFAAVGWIAADNPSQDQVRAVRSIVNLIADNAAAVTAGKTYTEVIYPVLDAEILAKLAPQYQPLARAASFSLLGALDMMFAVNPSWRTDTDRALAVVESFVKGVNMGFGLDDAHPAMLQARSTGKLRMQVLAVKPEGN